MTNREEQQPLFQNLLELGCSLEPCGSQVTCEPPPTGTDMDILVAVPDQKDTIARVVNSISGAGFDWDGEGSKHYQDVATTDFMSWRRANTNLIVTSNHLFAARHRVATKLCTHLNLLCKADRVAVFQAVLYGRYNDKGLDNERS